jgi:signal transduction histidine kinase/CheY-like chemotaxis protein
MPKMIKTLLQKIENFFRWNVQDHELMQSISKKVMGTTIGTYLAWHIVATLCWPQTFSPEIYIISAIMIAATVLSFWLLPKSYFLAMITWFFGLTSAVITTFSLFHYPAILLCLAIIPIMAEVMMGMRLTIILDALLITMLVTWAGTTTAIPFPHNYLAVPVLVLLAVTLLGWGIMDNLLSSIEAASYHYREAVQRLNEAREHRAEISVLLKDVNKANYQLENLNRMLIYARAQADEAREERDRFAMAVSHELRSPLNFIIGFSDLMVNSPDTYAKSEDWPHGLYDDIREIYKSSTHLMSLINDILDMGKMDAQQMVLFKEKIDFSLIIEDVRQMVHSAVESKGLELIILVEPDLPMVYVDRTRIRQVLLNLVTNALRFTRKGSITIHAFQAGENTLRIDVNDTGVGIAKTEQSKVFKEFRQVGTQNWQRGEGSGLGLSIGRRFIQMHGGEMGLESEAGKGSTFYFTIPIQQQIDALEEVDQEEDPEAARARRLQAEEKLPALVFLSHDAFSARVFAESLQGIRATLITDPERLFSTVASTYPRSVIIDESLENDPTVVSFIKEPPYDVPVFIFPIPLSRQSRSSNLPDGVSDYLVKPVPRQLMIETVARLDIYPHTILVVDDDPGMARFVAQTLKTTDDDDYQLPEDLNIVSALDGQEALRFIQALPIGLILLDLDLSDMNGLTLLNQMRIENKLHKIPVVIISASDPPPTFEPRKKGEFRVLVNRPFSNKELNDILNGSLHQVTPTFNTPMNDSESEMGSNDIYSDSDE